MTRPIAVVFGAGEGLGGAIARRFAREDFHVCATRRKLDQLKPLCEAIEAAGGSVSAHGVDEPELPRWLLVHRWLVRLTARDLPPAKAPSATSPPVTGSSQ